MFERDYRFVQLFRARSICARQNIIFQKFFNNLKDKGTGVFF